MKQLLGGWILVFMSQVVWAESPSTTPSTQPEKDVFVQAVDGKGKAVNCTIIVTAPDGSNGKRYWIPRQGKVIPHPEQEMVLYAFAERSSGKGDYFVAKQKVSPSDKNIKIVVHPENGVDVTFKILDKTGIPLSGGNIELYRMAGGYRIDYNSIQLQLNEKGMTIFNCHENGEYLVKYCYPQIALAADSDIFIPKNLKNSIYEYRIPPISSLTFGVRFVVQEKGQKIAVDIPSFMVQYDGKKVNRYGWSTKTDKKDKVAYLKVYDPADPDGLVVRVMTGEKYKIRINNEDISPYQLIPGRDSFIAGKKGEQIDFPVTPRVRCKCTVDMSTEGNVENSDKSVIIRPKGSMAEGLFLCSPWKAELPLGEYVVYAWAPGHELVSKELTAKEGAMTVACKLPLAKKYTIRIMDEKKNPIAGATPGQLQGSYLKLFYTGKKKNPGPNGCEIAANVHGVATFRCDTRYPWAICAIAAGYNSKVITLEKGKDTYDLCLSQAHSIPVTVKNTPFMQKVENSLDKKIYWISQNTRVQTGENSKLGNSTAVSLEPGIYIPVLSLNIPKVPFEWKNMAVVCKPVTITAETKDIEIEPQKLEKWSDIVD